MQHLEILKFPRKKTTCSDKSAISDYSGGNMFTDFKIDVNAKYGIDFCRIFEHQEIGLISNGRIFMESETVVNGSNSYPIYIGTGSFAMKNLTIQNMVLITKIPMVLFLPHILKIW